jgi:hypothetical protein
MFERMNEMLLTVSGSRLVRRSDTVLPAALNAVLVSSHRLRVLLSAMTCLNLDGQYWTVCRTRSRIERGSRNSKYSNL